MELRKIKALLADFYEGRTSLDDERLLMDFFLYSDVPAELDHDRLLFLSLHEASREEIADKQFDGKLFAAIEEHDRLRDPARVRRMLYAVSGIAAGILLLVGSYYFLAENRIHEIVYSDTEYTIDETRLAYEEARNALILVSQVMNTGTSHLGSLSKMTDATRELSAINKFHQGASELQILSKFEETREKITVKQ